jgi:hypothetical protein
LWWYIGMKHGICRYLTSPKDILLLYTKTFCNYYKLKCSMRWFKL